MSESDKSVGQIIDELKDFLAGFSVGIEQEQAEPAIEDTGPESEPVETEDTPDSSSGDAGEQEETMRCSTCRQTLPLSAFTPSAKKHGCTRCRACGNAYARSRRATKRVRPPPSAETLWCIGHQKYLPSANFPPSAPIYSTNRCRDCRNVQSKAKYKRRKLEIQTKDTELATLKTYRCAWHDCELPIRMFSPGAIANFRPMCKACMRIYDRGVRAAKRLLEPLIKAEQDAAPRTRGAADAPTPTKALIRASWKKHRGASVISGETRALIVVRADPSLPVYPDNDVLVTEKEAHALPQERDARLRMLKME